MEALPDTTVTQSMMMSAAVLGVIMVSGTVLVIAVFGNPVGKWLRGRRHRRESVHHPDQSCVFCGGTATRLVRHSSGRTTVLNSAPATSYRCKDRKLCQATRRLKKLIDSM